jgi:hypothetical protein
MTHDEMTHDEITLHYLISKKFKSVISTTKKCKINNKKVLTCLTQQQINNFYCVACFLTPEMCLIES